MVDESDNKKKRIVTKNKDAEKISDKPLYEGGKPKWKMTTLKVETLKNVDQIKVDLIKIGIKKVDPMKVTLKECHRIDMKRL
jgi:hypothetical protein